MLGAIIIIVIAVLLTKLIIYLSENSLDNHIDKSQNEKERLEQLTKGYNLTYAV